MLAARALLVTQGQQARDDGDALDLFTRHFLAGGLLPPSFVAIIGMAHAAVQTRPQGEFPAKAEDVGRFVVAIGTLYENMDASLRFKSPASEPPRSDEKAAERSPVASREADFRGVVCPLNYVRTKMLLDGMASGAVLSVVLDEAGARNVPASVEKDGHEVLSVQQEAEQWRILIRRA